MNKIKDETLEKNTKTLSNILKGITKRILRSTDEAKESLKKKI